MNVGLITEANSVGIINDIANRTISSGITSSVNSRLNQYFNFQGSSSPIQNSTAGNNSIGSISLVLDDISSFLACTLPTVEGVATSVESLVDKLSRPISQLLQNTSKSNYIDSYINNLNSMPPQSLQALFSNDMVTQITELVRSSRNTQAASSLTNDLQLQTADNSILNTTLSKIGIKSNSDDSALALSANLDLASNGSNSLSAHSAITNSPTAQNMTTQLYYEKLHYKNNAPTYHTRPERTPYDERQKKTKQQGQQKRFQGLKRTLSQILAKCQQLLDTA